ncbi:MAG: hypothetical protein J3Q66DRAFT_403998 [Benniella sp.]|nr:MAG: hypothetical protein J3Q66DRAFT_403998 [Benniella sp.]
MEPQAFFDGSGSLQDMIFSKLQEGQALPAWTKDRPSYQFKMQLRDDWGPRVTDLYKNAKTRVVLNHTHVDEISLLSGIVHLNEKHVGF